VEELVGDKSFPCRLETDWGTNICVAGKLDISQGYE
jgi:hypothetical protein